MFSMFFNVSIIGAAGHIVLTPPNQLMVMGQKKRSLSNTGFEPATCLSLAQRVVVRLLSSKELVHRKTKNPLLLLKL
jgi:hypothetical protein